MNSEKVIKNIMPYIKKNWNEIKKNKFYMDAVDMKKNNLCKKIKENNPELDDDIIKEYCFSYLIMMYITINKL
jgi:hypothetical protein